MSQSTDLKEEVTQLHGSYSHHTMSQDTDLSGQVTQLLKKLTDEELSLLSKKLSMTWRSGVEAGMLGFVFKANGGGRHEYTDWTDIAKDMSECIETLPERFPNYQGVKEDLKSAAERFRSEDSLKTKLLPTAEMTLEQACARAIEAFSNEAGYKLDKARR